MRNITHIAVHCSASQPDVKTDVNTIRRWHLQRGFTDVGYHYVIKTDGTLQIGRDESRTGAHVEGHNASSIGVCLIGGIDKAGRSVNNFSSAQFDALSHLLVDLKKRYPGAVIQGHRDFPGVKKDCPCFDVKSWLKTTGLSI